MSRFADLATAEQPPEVELVDPSFEPIDLGPVLSGDVRQPEPTILQRDDGQCLLYPGLINGIHGDSGVGKGWFALLAGVQQLRRGHTVILIDLEDTATSIVARLRLLGATDDEIAHQLVYVRPQAPFDLWAVDRLVDLVHERTATLAVIDSLGEAFGLDAVDENLDAEVGPWLRSVARRLAEAGPAVLLVDHATKAADNPLHPSGSKRKRAAIGGASYLVTATAPLSAGGGGRLRITCAKDRHGTYARSEHVADLVMTVSPHGTARVELYAPSETAEAELPVELAARDAVRVAAGASEPLSQRALTSLMTVKASNEILRAGVDLAAARGMLVEARGPRGSRLFTAAPKVEP